MSSVPDTVADITAVGMCSYLVLSADSWRPSVELLDNELQAPGLFFSELRQVDHDSSWFLGVSLISMWLRFNCNLLSSARIEQCH